MLASALNALLGLWLVYAAILDPALLRSGPWTLGISAAALLLLGVWAYRSDYLKWPGIAVIVIGIGLLAMVLSGARSISWQLTFWVTFWCGVVAGVLSLWSVFYRGESPQAAEPSESETLPPAAR
jgi:hypothetical protein